MECNGKITDIAVDYKTKRTRITIETNTKAEFFEDIRQVDSLVVIKKHREKRSHDANAYLWVLIKKLSIAIEITPEEIYKQSVRETSNYQVYGAKKDSVEKMIKVWESNGKGWTCEIIPAKTENIVNIKAYYGSSAYDSKEMKALLDIIIDKCKEQNIETITPEEAERLANEWGV